MSYVPLTQRDRPDPAFSGPHEGVPPWLLQPVKTYVLEAGQFGGYEARDTLKRFEAAAHVEQPIAGARYLTEAVGKKVAQDPDYALNLTDYLLRTSNNDAWRAEMQLTRALIDGGSAWRIVDHASGRHKLERAEPVNTSEAIQDLRSLNERVGSKLETARSAIYGRNPNPDAGYQLAVEAVEIAAHPVVTPKNPDATLGSVNAALKQAPAGKFAFVLDGKPEGALEAGDVVLPVTEALWRTQRRHGTDTRAAVTHAQAQAAYIAAVAACGWYLCGSVTGP